MTNITKFICDLLSTGTIIDEGSTETVVKHIAYLVNAFLPEGMTFDENQVADHIDILCRNRAEHNRNIESAHQYRVDREVALERARHYGLEAEVQASLDSGCSPEEALREWDI